MSRGKDYTTTEIAEIHSFLKDGLNYDEIAELTGRTRKAIMNLASKKGWVSRKGPRFSQQSNVSSTAESTEGMLFPAVKQSLEVKEEPATTPEPAQVSATAPVKPSEKTLKDYTFRELWSEIHNRGYRFCWENGELTCYYRQKVNLKDIIKNG